MGSENDNQKIFSSETVRQNNPMSQQLVSSSPDTGTVMVNINNQPFSISVFNEQSMRVAVATLNMLAEKFDLQIEVKKPQEQKSQFSNDKVISSPES